MAIPANTTGKVQYTGDGTTKTFPLTFPIFKTTAGVYAIRVSVADSSGESVTVLVENTDYTVNESGNSFCDVVLNTAPAAGKIITIIYNNELSQLYAPTDFTNLPAQSLINAFDKLTAICIQMSEELNRCVKESVESPVDPQVVVDKVNALYLHLSVLTALSAHLTEIDGVYGELANVVIAADDISNIVTVAGIKSKIDALAAITTAIGSCYTNMAAILDAPTQATAAAGSATAASGSASDAEASATAASGSATAAGNSATLAQDWATKMDGQVAGTDYSSKYYAEQSATSANNSNVWAEGTDEQVQALGGVHSAKVWAEQSTNANIDLSNLSATGQAVIDEKADIDADNFSQVGKNSIIGWGFPDYSAVVDLRSIFVGGSRSYTAPVKGFFIGNWHLVNAAITVKVNGIDVGYDVAAPNETNNVSVCLKLDVGDVLTASGNPSGNNGIFRFFPLKGA